MKYRIAGRLRLRGDRMVRTGKSRKQQLERLENEKTCW
jgi:hypothetical protein